MRVCVCVSVLVPNRNAWYDYRTSYQGLLFVSTNKEEGEMGVGGGYNCNITQVQFWVCKYTSIHPTTTALFLNDRFPLLLFLKACAGVTFIAFYQYGRNYNKEVQLPLTKKRKKIIILLYFHNRKENRIWLFNEERPPRASLNQAS